MLAVERMSRDALTEMHHLVGVLREDVADATASRRSPDLTTSPRCSPTSVSAGLPVELTVEGDRRSLAAGLELSAYRIVQEALTNSLKHAGPATATVSVRYRDDDLELRIADTGARARPGRDRRRWPRHPRHARTRQPLRRRAAGRPQQRRLPRPRSSAAGHAVIRVLLADDEALVRGGFRAILQAQPDIEVIAEACDGAEAVALAGELHPDVIVMDIRMPGIDGIEATRRIAARGSRTHVLILTTFGLDEYVYAALSAGASGFMLKNVPPQRLVDAIRTVAAGDALLAPSITRRLIEEHIRRPPRRRPAPRTACAAHPPRARGAGLRRARALERRDRAAPCSSARPQSRRTSPAC